MQIVIEAVPGDSYLTEQVRLMITTDLTMQCSLAGFELLLKLLQTPAV
jgi:hypothetical protein